VILFVIAGNKWSELLSTKNKIFRRPRESSPTTNTTEVCQVTLSMYWL